MRVFGDKVPPGETSAGARARRSTGSRTLGEHAKGSEVAVMIESHGDYTDSPTLHEMLTGAAGRTSRCCGTPIIRSSPARKSRPIPSRRSGRSCGTRT